MGFSWLAVILFVATSSAEEDLPWWKTATLYEVYPRSFMDSDGDGTGDLRGITKKADYLKEIGVDAIWLAPIYPSPMVDFGYDVSDFIGIDPIFGNMTDFETLMAKCKQLGIKVLMDYVPNHSSDKHPWFKMSENTSHPLHQDYRDFYVWMDPNGTTSDGQPVVPNNWISRFGGSAWEWSEKRKQFFLHQFAVEQPELNYRNPYVVGNMTDVLGFWIDKGVDGFRLDAVAHLFEDSKFGNEEPIEGVVGPITNFLQQNHTGTMHLPETFQLLDDWADYVYLQGLKKGRNIPVILEIYSLLEVMAKYYGTGKRSLKFPFNFSLIMYYKNVKHIRLTEIKDRIDKWMSLTPNDSVAVWVIGNHDEPRVPDRYGHEMVDTMNLLTGILPGVKVAYNGEEIGMENTVVSWNHTVDPWAKLKGPETYDTVSRDPERTPMQWDDTLNAGFSTNKTTWLPVNPNYWRLNVEAQRTAPTSHLKVFQAMVEARKDPVLQKGNLNIVVPDDDTFVVIRSYNESYFVLVSNFGVVSATYTSQNMFRHHGIDMNMTVVVGSVNSGYKTGTFFKEGSLSITLRPKASILLRSKSQKLFYFTGLLLICTLISILLFKS